MEEEQQYQNRHASKGFYESEWRRKAPFYHVTVTADARGQTVTTVYKRLHIDGEWLARVIEAVRKEKPAEKPAQKTVGESWPTAKDACFFLAGMWALTMLAFLRLFLMRE